jgi:cytochrome P450
VYRIWIGPEPALMLAHPQAIKELWSQHDEKCVQRNVHLDWLLEVLMENGVGFQSTSDRNRVTKFFHSSFGPSQVRRFGEHLEAIMSKFFIEYSSDILQSQNKEIFST